MNSSHDLLSEVLRSWRIAPPADPNFRHAVWQRITALRKRESWSAYLQAHAAAWTLVAVVALSVAGYTGQAVARAQVKADREAIVVAYLAELDPRVQAGLEK